ncbi:MAG: APC family permease [Clostridiales bacterium]|nr:APC family permease [Clostridiales bacterium]
MESKLTKKYGLPTAIAMVIGIVIGSGVFFKAEGVLVDTGGFMLQGVLAWAIGAAVMVICAYVFAVMATKYQHVNGLVDYSEATCGKAYGYGMAWFTSTIYYPAMTSVVAWVAARYFCVLVNMQPFYVEGIGALPSFLGPQCMIIAAFFLVAIYVINALSPKLAGVFQVSTTVIKLVPLVAMAVGGIIVGLISGQTVENFSVQAAEVTQSLFSSPLLVALCTTAFAYEGWVLATSINAELRDAKKNLPRALTLGTIIVAAVYILYYIGISGAIPSAELMGAGEQGIKIAFTNIFGGWIGIVFSAIVVISCLGTVNGLMMANVRGFYAMAVPGRGPAPETMEQLDAKTNIPNNSAVIGMLVAMAWLVFFYGANLIVGPSWFGFFSFDSSELPIITLYGAYIPMFVMLMVKQKDLGIFKRVIMPILAIASCGLMLYSAVVSHGSAVWGYLCVFGAIMVAGYIFYFVKKRKTVEA